MFDLLFGWSKASKCKKSIKKALYRIRILKNKRLAIVKQLRNDLVELIQGGHEQAALNRVEQLMKDEKLAAAYELLDNFCEFILTQISYIRKHRDCPNDIKEAISSLIFASARCGDIPELCVIRKLFGKRYGEKFVELFDGNLVDKQLKENLSGKYVPEDLKYRMVDEIARDNCLQQQQVLAIQYYPDWQKMQLKEHKECQLVESDVQINASISESKVHPSEIEEIERDNMCVHSSLSKPCDSCNLPKSCFDDSSAIVQQFPQYVLSYPIQNIVEDEILFKLRSSSLFKREKNIFGCDKSDIDRDESPSESWSTRISRRNKRAPRKRSKRRSSSMENLGIVDIGYMIYYQKPCRKDQRLPLEVTPPSSYSNKKLMLQSFSKKERSLQSCDQSENSTRRKNSNRKTISCSLDQPCYFFLYGDDEKDYLEIQSMKPKRVIELEATHVQQGNMLMHDECSHELNQGMELVTIPHKPYKKNIYSDVVECEANNGNNETKEDINASPIKRIGTEAPYSRAMTMPQERHRKSKDKMLRTYSCPSQHPNHIHPKLPDYDDIAAKFTALKRDYLENKDCLNRK
ncbi:uncharacterized protein [Cicer arietinum]|uniref:Uncharacterized protein LOC101498981 isoform X2 n=1 Tax=Cicer arietinum TaxID=3827 RepID=A0A1S2XFQ5_CICAR|nr:uncharacterized protein LOC101498981 isoform X2 [Cicer arietinum]